MSDIPATMAIGDDDAQFPEGVPVIRVPGGGLYNLIFGDGHERERGALAVEMLGTGPLGRFRDAWIEKSDDGPIVAIYTRNGGDNRRHCATELPRGSDCNCTGCIATIHLPANQYYIRDADDEFDGTYATFYFRVPDEYREKAAELAGEHIDMSAQWRKAIDALKEDEG